MSNEALVNQIESGKPRKAMGKRVADAKAGRQDTAVLDTSSMNVTDPNVASPGKDNVTVRTQVVQNHHFKGKEVALTITNRGA